MLKMANKKNQKFNNKVVTKNHHVFTLPKTAP